MIRENNQGLLRPGEMAEKLGVCKMTLWRWRKAGTGPAYIKMGERTVRYLPLKIHEDTVC